MRFLPLVLFFVFPFLAVSQVDSIANKISYANSNASIIEILEDLEKEYGIRFSYASSTKFNENMKVNFSNENLEDVLDYLLASKEMEFKIVSNNVLIRKTSEYSEIESDSYNSGLHVKGKVVAIGEDESLGYATVSIANSSTGTYTDEDGNFDLEIPKEYLGERLIVSFIGYSNMEYSISELDETFLLVPLTESPNLVQEVRIVNREKPIKISTYNNGTVLNKTQLLDKTSGVQGSNINRSVQLLPGITAHNDNSSAIQIRGSSEDATLTILDGIPIYRSSHYYGIYSAINTLYIDSVNVYKNIFPIQFSGKTGGIVEMLSSPAPAKKLEAHLDFNLLTSEGAIRIPVSKKSSFDFSGKTTIRRINNSNFNTKENRDRSEKRIDSFKEKIDNNQASAGAGFYDMHAKYLWSNGSRSKWSLNFFQSKELVDNSYETDISNASDNMLKIKIDEEGLWSSLGGSVLGNYRIDEKWKYSTRTYASSYREVGRNSISINKTSKPGDTPTQANLNAFQRNQLVDIGQDHRFEYFSNGHHVTTGVELSRNMVDYVFRENGKEVFGGLETIDKLSLYGSYDKLFANKFLLSTGIRTNYFLDLETVLFSPRILLTYHSTDKVSMKASFSNYQQVVRQLYFEYRAVPMEMWVSSLNEDVPILQTFNYMVGGTMRSEYFSLDVEAYFRKLLGVTEYAALNPEQAENNPDLIQDYRLFAGDGRVRGIDVIISSGYENYDTYLSYTLSKSEERYRGINKNAYYESENDRRHQFKWVNSFIYEQWRFGLNAIYSSGRPYTNITSTGENEDIRISTPDQRFNRLPAYKRLDVSTSYSIKVRKHKAEISLSVFNLLNNENVKYIQSVVTTVQENEVPFTSVVGGENSLLNRTINVGLKVDLSN